MADEPLDRHEALQRLRALAVVESTTKAAHDQAEAALKAAVLANSYLMLDRHHPAYLALEEIATAIGRHISRPAWWIKQLATDRDNIRAKMKRLLGRDPIPSYAPPDWETRRVHRRHEEAP